jgi:hypothetical protein
MLTARQLRDRGEREPKSAEEPIRMRYKNNVAKDLQRGKVLQFGIQRFDRIA